MRDSITVDADNGMELIVNAAPDACGSVDALLWHTASQRGVVFIISPKIRVAMDGTEVTGLWFGDTKITISWKSALKVADFLRLEIPLPVPLGEQVPA